LAPLGGLVNTVFLLLITLLLGLVDGCRLVLGRRVESI
jgi:hypothetical protein